MEVHYALSHFVVFLSLYLVLVHELLKLLVFHGGCDDVVLLLDEESRSFQLVLGDFQLFLLILLHVAHLLLDVSTLVFHFFEHCSFDCQVTRQME